MRNVTCNNCGWVHFPITKEYATTLYRDYTRCFSCGESYKNFRESKPNDVPRGCTIQPILDYTEFDYQLGISL